VLGARFTAVDRAIDGFGGNQTQVARSVTGGFAPVAAARMLRFVIYSRVWHVTGHTSVSLGTGSLPGWCRTPKDRERRGCRESIPPRRLPVDRGARAGVEMAAHAAPPWGRAELRLMATINAQPVAAHCGPHPPVPVRKSAETILDMTDSCSFLS